MYSRGRKDIHVGELLLLNIAACCCKWRDLVLFYLHASLDEKMLNIAPMFKWMLSFTVLLPKQFRVTHTAASLYFTVMSLSLMLFHIYL